MASWRVPSNSGLPACLFTATWFATPPAALATAAPAARPTGFATAGLPASRVAAAARTRAPGRAEASNLDLGRAVLLGGGLGFLEGGLERRHRAIGRACRLAGGVDLLDQRVQARLILRSPGGRPQGSDRLQVGSKGCLVG